MSGVARHGTQWRWLRRMLLSQQGACMQAILLLNKRLVVPLARLAALACHAPHAPHTPCRWLKCLTQRPAPLSPAPVSACSSWSACQTCAGGDKGQAICYHWSADSAAAHAV